MANTYTNLLYHIVFSTYERRRLIHHPFQEQLYPYLGGILRSEGGMLLEVGGTADHVHLVAKLKADTSVAALVKVVKTGSSGWAKKEGQQREFSWQRGYGAFTVSESQLDHVREYVRRQEEHHRKRSFQEELLELLDRHGVAYDPRYLWG